MQHATRMVLSIVILRTAAVRFAGGAEVRILYMKILGRDADAGATQIRLPFPAAESAPALQLGTWRPY